MRATMRRPYGWVLLLSALLDVLSVDTVHAVGIITTVAGGGPADGTPALSQPLYPSAVSVDQAGDVIVTEGLNPQHRIRRIDHGTGAMATIAGAQHDGPCTGNIGDGGPAIAACLGYPTGALVDGGGNLLIVDYGNQRIRRVDALSGIITTVAGGGNPCGPNGGPATDACLGSPIAIALDASGNLFILDTRPNKIRRVDAATQTITTVVLNPPGDSPGALIFDPVGHLILLSSSFTTGATQVYRLDPITYAVTSIAGNGTRGSCGDGGPATAACLEGWHAVFDPAGNLLISDTADGFIRRIDAVSGVITTIAGSGGPTTQCPPDLGDGGPAAAACLGGTVGLAIDGAGNILVTDDSRLRRIDAASGIITRIAGTGTSSHLCGDGGAATAACLDRPYAMTRDAHGNIYIADTYNYRIRRVDAVTNVITTVAGSPGGAFTGPCPPDIGDGGPALDACVDLPIGLALDLAGNLFISTNNRVRRVDATTGIITTVVGGGSSPQSFCGDGGPATEACLFGPRGLTVDGAGNLFIADASNDRIRRVDARTGRISTVAGNGTSLFCGDGGAATEACLFIPNDVAVDGAGNLFIADLGNARVRRVDALTGQITTMAGGGTDPCVEGGPATAGCFGMVWGVAADVFGNVFAVSATAEVSKVYRVDAGTGTITTVAGNGSAGFCGDGGPATEACLGATDVAVDLDGSLLINDIANDRIRRVTCDGPDSDGDGVCDEFDFADLSGLQLRTAMVREVRHRSGTANFQADVAAATFAPASGAQAFFAQAKQTGFVARLFSDAAPPALANLATIRVDATSCRFRPSTAELPRAVRCRTRGPNRSDLRLRQGASAGAYILNGSVRSSTLRVPPVGALRVVFDLNDPASLDYSAVASVCARTTSRLTCTGAP